MSIVCAVKKGGVIAIASDTQMNFGSLTVSKKHLKSTNKLFTVNDSIIGIVGWSAISDIIEHLSLTEKKLFELKSRKEIFSTLLKLQDKMKDEYFLETNEDNNQPVESNQLDAIIVNKFGMFEISSYREVHEYETFTAIGSGKRLALGAMYALYDSKASAIEIVEAGVNAAIEFDDGCGAPLVSTSLKFKK